MRFIGSASGGSKPTAPTIGAATDDGTGTGVSVAFTPSTYIGKGTITYTATSSPGSLTASGAGSPLVVSGLTTGTAYTFTINGTTNYGVTSDSSAASNSVTPVNPSSFESIATATGNGSFTTYTFSNIPQTYKSLQLRLHCLNGNAATRIQFNNDSGTNYTNHYMLGYGTSVTASGSTGQTYVNTGGIANPGNGSYPQVIIFDIIDYTSSAKYKVTKVFAGCDTNSSSGEISLWSSLWMNTAPITSIKVLNSGGGTEPTGGIYALYGVK